MPIVELIPLNKGNQLILDNTIITTIGRTPNIGCLDNKISRNHAQLSIKSDGTLWIKSIHHNPTFYKTKTNEIVRLTKDKEYQLFNNDEFGLLPNEYFYRISIKSKDENIEKISDHTQTINSSTIPKSPINENKISTIENHEEEKTESISDKKRALPTWMSNSSASSSTREEKLNKEKTLTTPSVKERTSPEGKKTKQIIYDSDDDDDEPTAKASSTEQASISNNINKTIHNGTSSTNVNSTKRERCPYGDSCFRKNPIHRQQAIHPGDSDWETEDDDKNETKPECPYGNECYRKNPDHFNEYHHPKKRSIEIKTKQRSTKHKAIENDDDDDDGLPNEYDYNDSFIDNEDLDSTDEEKTDDDDDDDIEWKPHKNSRHLNETDDDSTDDSDKELAKQEATEFIQSSTARHHSPVTKKPRVDDE